MSDIRTAQPHSHKPDIKPGVKVRVARGFYWPTSDHDGVVVEAREWTVTVNMGAQGVMFFGYNEVEAVQNAD